MKLTKGEIVKLVEEAFRESHHGLEGLALEGLEGLEKLEKLEGLEGLEKEIFSEQQPPVHKLPGGVFVHQGQQPAPSRDRTETQWQPAGPEGKTSIRNLQKFLDIGSTEKIDILAAQDEAAKMNLWRADNLEKARNWQKNLTHSQALGAAMKGWINPIEYLRAYKTGWRGAPPPPRPVKAPGEPGVGIHKTRLEPMREGNKTKLTKRELTQLIQEELDALLDESTEGHEPTGGSEFSTYPPTLEETCPGSEEVAYKRDVENPLPAFYKRDDKSKKET